MVGVVVDEGPTGRARMCCRSKPTDEQRQATRRAGRSPGCWQVLLPRQWPAILAHAACHLTYTRSGRCERACNDLPAYTNTWKRKSEPWSAPRDDSCIGFKEPIESRCQSDLYILILINEAYNCNNLLQLHSVNPIHDGKSFTARSEHPTRN